MSKGTEGERGEVEMERLVSLRGLVIVVRNKRGGNGQQTFPIKYSKKDSVSGNYKVGEILNSAEGNFVSIL